MSQLLGIKLMGKGGRDLESEAGPQASNDGARKDVHILIPRTVNVSLHAMRWVPL